MAEDQESKTEEATARRREDARNKGQVAFSSELATALVLLAAAGLLAFLGSDLGNGLLEVVRKDLPGPWPRELGTEEATACVSIHLSHGLRLAGPIVGMLVLAALAANLVQTGPRFSTDRLEFNLERISPIAGFGRLYSTAALVRGLLAVLKAGVLVILAWILLRSHDGQLLGLLRGGPAGVVAHGWVLTMRLILTLSGALVVLGGMDYAYQWFTFERGLRMSRQEVKDEHRAEEGDPTIKARVRKAQRELARRRMMAAVPKATVILTNPTHIAVALRYDKNLMPTPKVVAKGAGFVAERIKADARRYGIPVFERPALARAIYKAVNADQEIPAPLYQAVAEVLVFLYGLRGYG